MSINPNARKAIFERLRSASFPEKEPPSIDPPDFTTAASPPVGVSELADLYARQATLSRSEVISCSLSNWGTTLADLVQRKRFRSILAGRNTWISGELSRQIPHDSLSWFDEDMFSFKLRLFSEFDTGITTVRSAVAETGSLVVWPDTQEPRSLSLVPPTHIAILRASSIHFDLAGLMQAEAWSRGLPSNALLVSGPSKTADIQRILAFGAHGPKELIVLLIRDDLPGT
ncbi:lactate utilization protein C [Solimonas sp. K1W22B-7]|uniref:LutC/YkgG family protein n=1 Tax=Solimonas sp. K1W22B-7 TaxID=2303331 RepID=UPI000E32EDA6|nr:lactate utilization protein [Solimonas sp. K1W22B-7]AXQ31279.1 lactate utilization protein C [Solimonas sp. K1W22B-7]